MQMFQSAKDRKTQEELLRQRDILEAMGQALEWIEGSGNASQMTLQDMEQCHRSLDMALEQVVSVARRLQEEGQAQSKTEEELCGQMKELCQSCRRREEAYEQSVNLAREQQLALKEGMGQSRQLVEPLQELSEKARQLLAELEEAREEVSVMEEQGSSMSVRVLNAAIEAGRMGEPGRKFVAASEDVRGCAGEYRQAAVRMAGRLEKLDKRLRETEEQIVWLTGQLTDYNTAMETTDQSFNLWVEQLNQDPLAGMGAQIEKLLGCWEQKNEEEAGQKEYCEQILKHMEKAREEHMQEQQLIERLNSQQEQVRETIRERRKWG